MKLPAFACEKTVLINTGNGGIVMSAISTRWFRFLGGAIVVAVVAWVVYAARRVAPQVANAHEGARKRDDAGREARGTGVPRPETHAPHVAVEAAARAAALRAHAEAQGRSQMSKASS